MKTPCKSCGHAHAEHASDVSFPNTQRCFYKAATGEGCSDKYEDRCKNYVGQE